MSRELNEAHSRRKEKHAQRPAGAGGSSGYLRATAKVSVVD